MKYYKTYDDTWDNFFKFIKQHLKQIDKDSIGFMYRNTVNSQEIYIATLNNTAIDIIRTKYHLTECEQPGNFFDSDWAYTGNHNLFVLKLE